MEPSPRVSVVLNTYNRVELVGRAIESVQEQTFDDWELVVVDDGSDDGTVEFLDRCSTDRIRVVCHPNMGLTASRNAGALNARGAWIAFLDDDDTVEPCWLEHLVAGAKPDSGIVYCGHQQINPGGTLIGERLPQPMGAIFLGSQGSFWPGTWMMRRDVFDHAGGYLDGLPFIHQFELLLRAVRSCDALGLTTSTIAEPLLRYTVRDNDDRPMQWPQLALDGGRWVLGRHHAAFETDRLAKANLDGVVGVAAARMGRLDLARRHLFRSVVAQPSNPKRYARALAALSPWTARRAWGATPGPGGQPMPLPNVHRLPAAHRRDEDHRFLPWRYQQNVQASADSEGMPYWEQPSLNNTLYQEPVYRYARGLIKAEGLTSVLDVGTGSGVKLERIVLPVADRVAGFDQGSGIQLARERCPGIEWMDGDLMSVESWERLADHQFDLLICADVVEHVDDPVFMLQRMAGLLGGSGQLLISTPDRMRFDVPTPLGPPSNCRHVREWTRDEFELLLESTGYEIIHRKRFLPRGYRATTLEVKRIIWRLLHRQAIPDKRSNVAWLCRRSAKSQYTPADVGAGDRGSGLHR
jgi:2-polyprenyl-3-methyl-5-hydroxy-6-metoxy-1,4-benzoquinol methylase